MVDCFSNRSKINFATVQNKQDKCVALIVLRLYLSYRLSFCANNIKLTSNQPQFVFQDTYSDSL